jgi:hypothetical protein
MRIAVASVEIGLYTPFIENYMVDPGILPLGPTIWVILTVLVFESNEQGLGVLVDRSMQVNAFLLTIGINTLSVGT